MCCSGSFRGPREQQHVGITSVGVKNRHGCRELASVVVSRNTYLALRNAVARFRLSKEQLCQPVVAFALKAGHSVTCH